jgi:hypothetical protein
MSFVLLAEIKAEAREAAASAREKKVGRFRWGTASGVEEPLLPAVESQEAARKALAKGVLHGLRIRMNLVDGNLVAPDTRVAQNHEELITGTGCIRQGESEKEENRTQEATSSRLPIENEGTWGRVSERAWCP